MATEPIVIWQEAKGMTTNLAPVSPVKIDPFMRTGYSRIEAERPTQKKKKQISRIGIGYHTGSLAVIEKTDQRKNGYMIWKCRCDCGGEILLDTRTLQRGTVQDCGCRTKVPPGVRDLTGRRFGRLTVLEALDERSEYGSVVWLCRCDCGNKVKATGHSLTNNYKKSCGCLGHPPVKDYVGRRFHKLTVKEYAGKKDGMHRWLCVCDCGKETIVGQTLLQSGKTKSCGCLQADVLREQLKLVDGTSVLRIESSRKKLGVNNTSGHVGVYKQKRSGKWIAQITFRQKTYYLGSFTDFKDAVAARERGEEMFDDFLNWYYNERENT